MRPEPIIRARSIIRLSVTVYCSDRIEEYGRKYYVLYFEFLQRHWTCSRFGTGESEQTATGHSTYSMKGEVCMV
jgi:hypothetical protein